MSYKYKINHSVGIQLDKYSKLKGNLNVKNKIGGKDTVFVQLNGGGKMNIKKGYAWDGSSGPSIDTKENMFASLIHDALYQLMRRNEGCLGGMTRYRFRRNADLIFYKLCRANDMSWPRAGWHYTGVRRSGKNSTKYNPNVPKTTKLISTKVKKGLKAPANS